MKYILQYTYRLILTHSLSKNNAIFLAIILVAGTISTVIPQSFAQFSDLQEEINSEIKNAMNEYFGQSTLVTDANFGFGNLGTGNIGFGNIGNTNIGIFNSGDVTTYAFISREF